MYVRKAESIDECLASVPAEQRDVLEKLRGQIREAGPGTVETISYGIPFFKLGGEYVAGFAAYKRRCSFALWEGKWQRLIDTNAVSAEELEGYETSAGTTHFTQEKPLPAPLVMKLMKARITEIEAKAEAKR